MHSLLYVHRILMVQFKSQNCWVFCLVYYLCILLGILFVILPSIQWYTVDVVLGILCVYFGYTGGEFWYIIVYMLVILLVIMPSILYILLANRWLLCRVYCGYTLGIMLGILWYTCVESSFTNYEEMGCQMRGSSNIF